MIIMPNRVLAWFLLILGLPIIQRHFLRVGFVSGQTLHLPIWTMPAVNMSENFKMVIKQTNHTIFFPSLFILFTMMLNY